MMTQTGDTTTFYNVCGDKVGSMKTINGTDNYYDARGKRRDGVDLSIGKRRC
jgi:hypothetical protein